MANRFEGRVAVVTGGGNGIGRATVLRLCAEGARVVVADVNEETGAETVRLAAAAGRADAASFVRADVTVEADVEGAIALATEAFGRLDLVFNNAGVAGAFGPITHLRVEDFDFTMAVLVRGVFLGMKHAARVMKGGGGEGVIINTASVAGMSGGEAPQAYSAAKAAVINLTRAVAVELAPDRIRVNAICPGGINTPLLHRGDPESMAARLAAAQPWPEHGRPEDIAGAVAWLASDDARFVTGAAIVVDGGLTAAGGNLMRSQLGGEASVLLQVVGVDHGSTGRESTAEPIGGV
jgi:NAD(P)-dependent dehydrogenase (short-subunit alcohol dehydrogenase family)